MSLQSARKRLRAPASDDLERGWVLLPCARCEGRIPHRRLMFQVALEGAFGMSLSVPGHRCLSCGLESRAGKAPPNGRTLAWDSRTCVGS